MKYLVITAISLHDTLHYPGAEVELMRFIGDQLVANGVLLPIVEETAPIEPKAIEPKAIEPVAKADLVIETVEPTIEQVTVTARKRRGSRDGSIND